MQLKWKRKVSLISYFTIGLLSPCHQFCLAKYHALLHTYMHAYLHVCMSYTCRERVLYPSSSHDYFKLSQRHYIKQGTFSTYKNQAILVTRAPVNICVHGGSGCGSVGRAVAFDIRGPWFDSSHRQNLY